jgi:DNA-binding NtrC family response regulator
MKNETPKVVLIVDDEESFHELYTYHLDGAYSLKFLYAQSGLEAYDVMAKEKIDLVISDINMPNGSGLWLLDKLSKEYSTVPVIIASNNEDLHEHELIKLGASAFVPKLDLSSLVPKFLCLI